jgi:hypothetical protein
MPFERMSRWAAVLWALSLALAFHLSSLHQLWMSGFINDPDDAMRLVMLHEWMNGHEWYNETITRLDPPKGVYMHWSHVIDIPLALLFKLFSLVTDTSHADTLMRISYPILLETGVLICGVKISDLLYGPSQRLVVALAIALSGALVTQFYIGRIHHTSAQILCLSVIILCWLNALKYKSLRYSYLCGACLCLSLAINVENIPFIAIIIASFGLSWAHGGNDMARPLRVFGLSLTLHAPIVFAVFYDPAHWSESHADAMSFAHVSALIAGGIGLMALSFCSLSKIVRRYHVLAIIGAAWLIFIRIDYPILLGDPYAGLDPLVRAFWLDHVQEVQNIVQFYDKEGIFSFGFYIPIAIGTFTFIWAACRTKNTLFACLGALSCLGFITTLIVIRAYAAAIFISALSAPLIAQFITKWLDDHAAHLTPRLWGALIAVMACSTFVWCALVLILQPQHEASEDHGGAHNCFDQTAYQQLAALPQGLVLANINLGSHLLLYTPHNVVSAPYHRNNHGNRLGLDIWSEDIIQSEHDLHDNHIDYIVLCGEKQAEHDLIQAHPTGLRAQLLNNKSPDFLDAIDLEGVLHIWRVK